MLQLGRDDVGPGVLEGENFHPRVVAWNIREVDKAQHAPEAVGRVGNNQRARGQVTVDLR